MVRKGKFMMPPSPSSEDLTEITEVQKPKRRWWVVVAIPLGIFVLLGIGFYPLIQTTAPTPTPKPTPILQESNASTVLSVDSDNATSTPLLVSVPITINTGKNTVSAVELHLSFDPQKSKNASVSAGAFFTDPTILKNEVDQTNGKITFILGSLTPKQGTGVVAILSLEPVGTITLAIDPETKVAAIGEKENVLKSYK